MKKYSSLIIIAVLVATNIVSATIAIVKPQPATVELHDGDMAVCVCATATSTPVSPLPTETPEPTATIESPLPTPTTASPLPTSTPEPTVTITPQPTDILHGVVRSPEDGWLRMRDELGARLVELLVRPTREYTDAVILAALDEAQEMGLGVLVHIHDGSTDTDMPWSLSNREWTITARGHEILQLVEGHPALWGVYQLEEPWDYTSSGFVSADDQRALYKFLKGIAPAAPLYTDMATMARAVEAGYELSDGMCDYCCTAPVNWNRGLTETLRRIDAEYAAWQATMDEAQLVYMINTYGGAGHRLPTVTELDAVQDHICALGIPHVYYPWHGYTENLSTATYLWPVIAEGCDGATPPTPTPRPTTTPESTATPGPTDTPAPTSTPDPGSAIIIDHSHIDANTLSKDQLDKARALVTFFNHKSIGNNILDGIADLQAQNPGRYTIAVRYSSGTAAGINHYQAGANQHPMDKVSGFAALVKDGHDLAMMKFCVGDFEPWTSYDAEDIWLAYRDMMIEQQAEHPGTVMVWWTAPLTTQSDARGLASFAEFNGYVRAYVNTHGGVLFDIADIESHDPIGNPITKNGLEAMYNGYSTDGAHLNELGRQRAASALWWLLAEVAQ